MKQTEFNQYVDQVATFRRAMGLPIAEPSTFKLEQHLGFIREELDEYHKATDEVGRLDALADIAVFAIGAALHCKKRLQIDHFDKLSSGDYLAEIDAILNLDCEHFNLYAFYSLTAIPDELRPGVMKAVFEANMGKFCTSKQEALNRAASLKDECFVQKCGDYWTVRRLLDNKLMKPAGWIAPEPRIKKLIEEVKAAKLQAAQIADDEQQD